MNTWTIINGDTLCLNGRPVASIRSTERAYPNPLDHEYKTLDRDERRELLEELNRKNQ